MVKKAPKSKDRYRSYLEAEQEAAALYRTLAAGEKDAGRAQVFQELAEAETRHAALWATKLGLDPGELPPHRPGLRTRLLGWLARRLGTKAVLPMLLREEYSEIRTYSQDSEASSLVQEERDHARTLGSLAGIPASGGILSGERQHRLGGRGNVRAAVLGGNDGLVSNLSLVMGVSGGTSDANIILLAGVSGLLAGAFSMAGGEYVSMRAQRDVYEHQIELERAELAEMPEEEQEELARIYRAKGLSREEATVVAQRIMKDPEVALDTMMREELELSLEQLGSPWGASISSFVAFAAGAAVPVLPYLVGSGAITLTLSAILSAGALLAVGSLLAALTSKHALWGGLRMLLIGAAAATVTFGIGTLVGAAID